MDIDGILKAANNNAHAQKAAEFVAAHGGAFTLHSKARDRTFSRSGGTLKMAIISKSARTRIITM